MTTRERKILIVGALAIVVLGLFPPWREKADIPYKLHFEKSLGYHFIASPPTSSLVGAPRFSHLKDQTTIQVDLSRLMIQWIVTGIVVTVLYLVFRAKQN